jgi:predicted transcriptional regulator
MAATGTTTSTEKGRRIVGAERTTLAKDLVKRYTGGESIRALAASTGRSYGFVHRVLTESGVQLRQRGGARRRKKAA